MKSRHFIMALAVVFALAALAGCAHNKAQEQKNGNAEKTAPEAARQVELPPFTVTPVKPNDPPAVTVKVAFAKMELGTSPTFGLVFRNFVMALYARDYDKAWAMFGPGARGKVEAQRRSAIEGLEMASMGARLMISRTGTEGGRAALRAKIQRWDAQADKVQQFNAQQFFAWIMQLSENSTGDNPAYPYFVDPPKFVREQVEGDTGFAKIDAPAPNDKLPFARENGEWKIDFTPLTKEQVALATR